MDDIPVIIHCFNSAIVCSTGSLYSNGLDATVSIGPSLCSVTDGHQSKVDIFKLEFIEN